ncbi:hypothetical protein QBC42DRAFT_332936 [Cladorrhinum samala]|uniref:Apple domain-containing protein n=1 Tax=Cladorrhinum samala TaxID=585594 RepID=A0AAV9HYJ3_9PEZI|nr:hypothetical protein QBC42DRAFT_332936 [Cladorrhinum samala]
MLPPGHSLVMKRARINRRQSNSPCPSGNGTTVGTSQQFTVLCNTQLEGDVLDRLAAFDYAACLDLCSSFHPKCDGASFDGSRCTLRARLRPAEARLARRIDSGLATFPGASSNCATLQGNQQVLSSSFNLRCGFIIAGNDVAQNYAPTFQDCLGQCAATSGCAAVSFDPSQELGFKNCYLKSIIANPSTEIAADRRTDSAILAGSPGAAPDQGAGAGAGAGVATIPIPSASVSPGNGVVFFTPPANGGTGAATTAAPLPTNSPLSDTIEPTPSSVSSLAAPPPPPQFTFFPTPGNAASPDSLAQGDQDSSSASSNAWIAAPVVGSVAAIALIVISFIMLKRRRGRSSSSPHKKFNISRPIPILSGWFGRRSQAPVDSFEGSSSGRRKTMGNFSEVGSGATGTRDGERDLQDRRRSVLGFVTGRPAGMERLDSDIEEGAGAEGGTGEKGEGTATPVYEVRNGRAELRNSLNGLGQNRWS